jgi:hypothetical protein
VTRKVVVTDLSVQVRRCAMRVPCVCHACGARRVVCLNPNCSQLDAEHAAAYARRSLDAGAQSELKEKESLQLTCIINVKPGACRVRCRNFRRFCRAEFVVAISRRHLPLAVVFHCYSFTLCDACCIDCYSFTLCDARCIDCYSFTLCDAHCRQGAASPRVSETWKQQVKHACCNASRHNAGSKSSDRGHVTLVFRCSDHAIVEVIGSELRFIQPKVWCVVCGVRCEVCGVRCDVGGVRCEV